MRNNFQIYILNGSPYPLMPGRQIYDMQDQLLLWQYAKEMAVDMYVHPKTESNMRETVWPHYLTFDMVAQHVERVLAPQVAQEYRLRDKLNSLPIRRSTVHVLSQNPRLLEAGLKDYLTMTQMASLYYVVRCERGALPHIPLRTLLDLPTFSHELRQMVQRYLDLKAQRDHTYKSTRLAAAREKELVSK